MTDRSIRDAACSCGSLRLSCAAPPLRVSMCHCLACQRRTGSVFAANARFPKDAVTITGTVAHWTRTGDKGGRSRFGFCPTCGATVFWESESVPDQILVAVGAFADPGFPAPGISIYEDRAHPWVFDAGGLPLERIA